MAIIVKHIKSGKRYALIGAGFGAYKSSRPGVMLGGLAPVEDKGEIPSVLLCDQQGDTIWVFSKEIRVVSIDGELPAELLGEDV